MASPRTTQLFMLLFAGMALLGSAACRGSGDPPEAIGTTTTAATPAPHQHHPAEGTPPAEFATTCASPGATQPPITMRAYDPGDGYGDLVAAAKERYRALHMEYEPHLQEYTATGDYLNYGATMRYEADPTLHFDDAGVPLVEYDGVYQYNPVTVAEFTLTVFGRYEQGRATLAQFTAALDVLMGLQDDEGALRFPFAYTYYLTGERFEPGWTSAMAQGQALSAYRRAFEATGDEAYLRAGEAALRYLATWRSDGGMLDTLAHFDPALDGYAWFPEYPSGQPYYTLNGFVFTLLGLHDWSTLTDDETGGGAHLAGELFDCGMASLELLLPYYDANGFSIYDLGHVLANARPNIQADYHPIHIHLLHALESIRPNAVVADYLARWITDVDTP